MRISHKKRPEKALLPQYRKNQFIIAPEVLVLAEDGSNLGLMETKKAIGLAQEKELDLVEINPKANPPVAKLIDFAEFKYQKEKELRKQKVHSRASDIKGIRLSLRIGEHDLEIKKQQAVKFLDRGDKVKIELMLRGREMIRPDMGRDLIIKFIAMIETTVATRTEQEPEKQGHKITAIIAKR